MWILRINSTNFWSYKLWISPQRIKILRISVSWTLLCQFPWTLILMVASTPASVTLHLISICISLYLRPSRPSAWVDYLEVVGHCEKERERKDMREGIENRAPRVWVSVTWGRVGVHVCACRLDISQKSQSLTR